MAEHVGAHYRALGLLHTSACPSADQVGIWADSSDDRTIQSGQIWAEHLLPGCKFTSTSMPAHDRDPLFSGNGGILTTNADRIGVERDIANAEANRPADVGRALAKLQALLGNTCNVHGAPPCLDVPNTVAWHKGSPHLTGGLSTAATMSENLLLQYLDDMPSQQVAWGQNNLPTLLAQVLPAHEYQSDLIRRSAVVAHAKGDGLAHAISSILSDQKTVLSDGSLITRSAQAVIFAGHDTTLDALATIYGLNWTFEDQPDRTAPDTTLAFERWRNTDGTRLVKVVVFHQSLDEIRYLQPLPATESGTSVAVGACVSGGHAACLLERFVKIAGD